MTLVIRKDAGLVDVPFETAERIVQALAIAHYDFGQV